MRENPTQKTAKNLAQKAAEKAIQTATRFCAICARVATARDWHKPTARISVPIIIGTMPDFADIIGTRKTLAKWAFHAFLCQCANDFFHLHTIDKKIYKKIYIGGGDTRARVAQAALTAPKPTAKPARKSPRKSARNFTPKTPPK